MLNLFYGYLLILVKWIGQYLRIIPNKRFCGILVALELPHKPRGHIAVRRIQHLPVIHAGAQGYDGTSGYRLGKTLHSVRGDYVVFGCGL